MDMNYLIGLALPFVAAHVPHPGPVYAPSKPTCVESVRLPALAQPEHSNPNEREYSKVTLYVWYSHSASNNHWKIVDSTGKVVDWGGPGQEQSWNRKRELDLAPGRYRLHCMGIHPQGWNGGFVLLQGLGWQFGPVQPGNGASAWTFEVPEPQRSAATDTSAQSFPKLLHGWIEAGGETVQGYGFDLEKHGAGLYRIRFRNSFSRAPTVVASPATVGQHPQGIPLNMVQIAAVRASDCWIEVFNYEGLPEDGGFTFMAWE
jgi:hypothetical protein